MRLQFTAPTTLNTWLDFYDLKRKLRVPPNQSNAIYNNALEMATYFHTYVGALYVDKKSLKAIQDWISKLIDPTAEPPVTIEQFGQDGIGITSYRNSYPSPQSQTYSSPSSSGIFSSPPASSSYSVPTPPAGPPPPLPSSPPRPLAGTINLISLSLVNQTAVQKNFSINYVASQEGPPHQPTWTVRCLINNVERGIGVGKSQKNAKEEAARRAWLAMGW